VVYLIPELLEYALVNRRSIINGVQELNVGLSEVAKKWTSYSPESIPSIGRVAAVDGSLNFIDFRGFLLYAVDAAALVYGDRGYEDGVKTGKVGLLYPSDNVLERVRHHMAILELRTILKVLEDYDIDLALNDGSYVSFFAKAYGTHFYFLSRKTLREFQDLIESLSKSIGKGELKVQSEDFFGTILERIKDVDKAIKVISFLERLETFQLLLKLLKDFGNKIVSISKTSVSRRYFSHSLKPDLVVFSKMTLSPGFSQPEKYVVSIPSDIKGYLKEYCDDKVTFTVFYARTEPDGMVFRVEIPEELDISEIKDLLSRLRSLSVKGYPYPLRRVHREVEICAEDMLKLYRILSLYGEEKGREML